MTATIKTMKPRANLWIEIDGCVVLSRWRVQLLAAVSETGSISGAADHMGIPYRCAWEKIHEMEKGLSVALLETQTGGSGGGGARLTPAAQDLIARFQHFDQGIDSFVQHHFKEAFGDQGQ